MDLMIMGLEPAEDLDIYEFMGENLELLNKYLEIIIIVGILNFILASLKLVMR